MAEITAIKTGKAPIEYVTVKLSPVEARDLAKAYRNSYPWMSGSIPRLLERAAAGETSVLTQAEMSFAQAVLGKSY